MDREYSGVLKRVDVFQHANSKFRGKHECDIFDEDNGSIVTCTCGLRIAMRRDDAEPFSDNHEHSFNEGKPYVRNSS